MRDDGRDRRRGGGQDHAPLSMRASKKYMDALCSATFSTPLEKDGVDFWWLDWQQYAYTKSVPDLTNLFWLNTLAVRPHRAATDQRGNVVQSLGRVGAIIGTRSSFPATPIRGFKMLAV